MAKMQGLQQALNDVSSKTKVDKTPPVKASNDTAQPTAKAKAPSREGKEFIGAWLNGDFGTSLRLTQIRKRKDVNGNKVYLDDLVAEALNDLFQKYDVPTVHHE